MALYEVSLIVNGLCLIPSTLLLLSYLSRIKEFTKAMIINSHLCLICIFIHLTYFFPRDNFQGSLFVSCLATIILYCWYISLLFFLITLFPNFVEKHHKFLYYYCPFLFWAIFISLNIYLFLKCQFYGNVIDFIE